MTKKQKLTVVAVAVFAAILLIVAGMAVFLNIRETQEGTKEFQVEVISDRDGFTQITEEKSDLTYLGEYLRTVEDCQWEESEWGVYLKGFYGMEEDISQEYWWCITVNDAEISLGADQIPLQDGDKYTFTLLQGW